MNTNRNKLALRRQSIRTLTDSELRIAHGGGNGAGASPVATTSANSVSVSASSGTSVIHPSGGSVVNPSGGSVANPSVGRVSR